jgi:hypothetical protein
MEGDSDNNVCRTDVSTEVESGQDISWRSLWPIQRNDQRGKVSPADSSVQREKKDNESVGVQWLCTPSFFPHVSGTYESKEDGIVIKHFC